MSAIYGWFTGKLIWLVVIALLGAVILGQRAQVSNAKASTARAQADFSDYKAAAAENRLLADRAQRTEEQRHEDTTRKAIDEAKQRAALATADAVGARAAGERVSRQLAAFTAAARRASADPAAAGGSAPAADPIGVLADVLGRADRRAGILAAFADAARGAGTACERIADGLQPPPGPVAGTPGR
jgi:hypothetical protein